MTDCEESKTETIERLKREVELWKKNYSDQIKTDEEWEVYIKKSREQAQEQSKQKLLFWIRFLL